MVAVKNYSPEDRRQLSFHKGDIIHLKPLEHPERGEQPLIAPHARKPPSRGHRDGRTGGFACLRGHHAWALHPVVPHVPVVSSQTTTMAAWSARR